MVAEQGHVYLIPANTALTMTGRRIRVTPNRSKLHHPGDILFTSLAKERGDSAIGVVLPGLAPTEPSAYKRSSEAVAPHLRSTRDLPASQHAHQHH